MPWSCGQVADEDIYGPGEIRVNSYHHQGVRKLADLPGGGPCTRRQSRRLRGEDHSWWVTGVRWHPENEGNISLDMQLIEAFVAAAASTKETCPRLSRKSAEASLALPIDPRSIMLLPRASRLQATPCPSSPVTQVGRWLHPRYLQIHRLRNLPSHRRNVGPAQPQRLEFASPVSCSNPWSVTLDSIITIAVAAQYHIGRSLWTFLFTRF